MQEEWAESVLVPVFFSIDSFYHASTDSSDNNCGPRENFESSGPLTFSALTHILEAVTI